MELISKDKKLFRLFQVLWFSCLWIMFNLILFILVGYIFKITVFHTRADIFILFITWILNQAWLIKSFLSRRIYSWVTTMWMELWGKLSDKFRCSFRLHVLEKFEKTCTCVSSFQTAIRIIDSKIFLVVGFFFIQISIYLSEFGQYMKC